jgi:hypothetical protein
MCVNVSYFNLSHHNVLFFSYFQQLFKIKDPFLLLLIILWQWFRHFSLLTTKMYLDFISSMQFNLKKFIPEFLCYWNKNNCIGEGKYDLNCQFLKLPRWSKEWLPTFILPRSMLLQFTTYRDTCNSVVCLFLWLTFFFTKNDVVMTNVTVFVWDSCKDLYWWYDFYYSSPRWR